jgi:hypothetical protein
MTIVNDNAENKVHKHGLTAGANIKIIRRYCVFNLSRWELFRLQFYADWYRVCTEQYCLQLFEKLFVEPVRVHDTVRENLSYQLITTANGGN